MARSLQQPFLEGLAQHKLLELIALRLPDPAALGATCRAINQVLDGDAMLLEWAEAHQQHSTASPSRRHPGYTLLHWRRLRGMSTQRLAKLLIRWSGRPAAISSGGSGGSSSGGQRAQQLLDSGDAVAALQAVLPHSQHLLLVYAAQAGNTRLLADLIAATPATLKLSWNQTHYAQCCMLRPAVYAAVRSDQLDAMHMLLGALENTDLRTKQLQEHLLATAISSGSANCSVALLELCSGLAAHSLLLASRLGHEAVVRAVLGTGAINAEGRANAYEMALGHGLWHLLPLLKPDSMSQGALAAGMCVAAGRSFERSSSAPLALLPQAMWEARDEHAATEKWRQALLAILQRNSVETLEAVWDKFSAAPAAQQTALADAMLSALIDATAFPCTEAAQWLLSNVLPCIKGKAAKAKVKQVLELSALAAMRNGHLELVQALQPAAVTAKLVSKDLMWESAQKVGQLLSAVRQGDVPAAQAELTATHMVNWPRVMMAAFSSAIALKDPTTAEAMMRALVVPFQQMHGYIPDTPRFLWAHDGAILKLICELDPEADSMMVGSAAFPELCEQACMVGAVGAAEWLVRNPRQVPGYLGQAAWAERDSCCVSAFSIVDIDDGPDSISADPTLAVRPLHFGFTELLHRLADKQLAGCSAAGAGAGGDAPGAGGRAAAASGSSGTAAARETGRAASEGGSAGDREEEEEAGPQPPAGARVLTGEFLRAILHAGFPDLLHALLVFMDSWGDGARG